MKHRPDARGILYFAIAVLSVWSGEIANLGGGELFARLHDRWPALAVALLLASYALGPVDFEDDTENQVQTP